MLLVKEGTCLLNVRSALSVFPGGGGGGATSYHVYPDVCVED